jgi:predicted glycosyltransferase
MDLAKNFESEAYFSTARARGEQNGFYSGAANAVSAQTINPFLNRRNLEFTASVLQPKILLYSHDTFGLGNIRRTLLLAENLINEYPRASVLIITGSPVIHAFRLPEGIDYIKLPALDRVDAEKYEPLLLADCAEEIRRTRAAILEKAVLGFAPDLFIVDKRAAGIDGELLGTLELLKEKNFQTKIVLGLRDILDEPERTSKTLRENGSFEVIEKFYDEVWIYGAREIFDTAKEYSFPATVVQKTRYCGYLKRPVMKTVSGNGALRVLVTTGGGGDGSRMIETYLESLPFLTSEIPVRSTVIFGPQMANEKRADLLNQYGYLPDIKFLDFEPELAPHYAEADVVVSMAGYNTVCELLSHDKRAVLVPRAEPVMEQLIRARLLARQGFFQIIEPAELCAETMKRKVIGALKTTSIGKHFLNLDGLPRINERVQNLLSKNGSAL